jgi:hypothetical protein
MIPRTTFRIARVWCLLVAMLVLPAPAGANIGPRWWGDLATEPAGLKEVAILCEELVIDLRPLAAGEPGEVQATYHLSNFGPARKLDLLFVFGTEGVTDFEVWLDGRPVESKPLSQEEFEKYQVEVPTNWNTWVPVQGIDRQTNAMRRGEQSKMAPVAFSLDLPTGGSTLTARYRARACGTGENSPMATWHFPYVLSPAKS